MRKPEFTRSLFHMHPDFTPLPNLIIGGVDKAGTTSLFSYLASHPDICGSWKKETRYFSPLYYGGKMESLSRYAAFFTQCGKEKYRMEATPNYLFGGRRLAHAIRDALEGDIRILFILRDPITRFCSAVRFKKSRLRLAPEDSMTDYIARWRNASPDELRIARPFNAIEGSFYAKYLPAWYDVFRDQIRIVWFEHMQSDSEAVVRDLGHWLGLDPEAFAFDSFAVHNRTVSYKIRWLQRFAVKVNRRAERWWRRWPRLKVAVRSVYYAVNGKDMKEELRPADRDFLDEVFRPHNRRLADLVRARGYKELPQWVAQA